MNKPLTLIAGISAAGLMLTGCSGGQEPTPTATVTVTHTPAPTGTDGGEPAEPEATTEPADNEVPEEPKGGGGVPYPQGNWAPITGYYESGEVQWEIRVTETLVTDYLLQAAENPDYANGDYDAPVYVDAHAQEGHHFVAVTHQSKNTTGQPASATWDVMIAGDDGNLYAATGQAEEINYWLNYRLGHNGDVINPNEVYEEIFVVEIPNTVQPVGATFIDVYIGADPSTTVFFDLSPVGRE